MADSRLKYGVRFGMPLFTTVGEFNSSVVLSPKSGRYVTYDESGDHWILTPDNGADIGGYVQHSLTTSSTDKGTKLPIATNIGDFITEMPYANDGSASTLTAALLLDLIGGDEDLGCDIYVSTLQYADAATSQKVIRVHGGSVKNNTLYVSVIDTAIDRQA